MNYALTSPSLDIVEDILANAADRRYVHQALDILGYPVEIMPFISGDAVAPAAFRASRLGCLTFIQFILVKLTEKDRIDCVRVAAEHGRLSLFHFLAPLVDLSEHAADIAYLTMGRDVHAIFRHLIMAKLIHLGEDFLIRAIDRNAVEIVAVILEKSNFIDYTPFLARARARSDNDRIDVIRIMLQEKIAEKFPSN